MPVLVSPTTQFQNERTYRMDILGRKTDLCARGKFGCSIYISVCSTIAFLVRHGIITIIIVGIVAALARYKMQSKRRKEGAIHLSIAVDQAFVQSLDIHHHHGTSNSTVTAAANEPNNKCLPRETFIKRESSTVLQSFLLLHILPSTQ